VQLTKVTEHL